MSREQLVRQGVWYIGGRKRRRKQKGGFLPVASILGPLSGPAISAVADSVLKKIFANDNRR